MCVFFYSYLSKSKIGYNKIFNFFFSHRVCKLVCFNFKCIKNLTSIFAWRLDVFLVLLESTNWGQNTLSIGWWAISVFVALRDSLVFYYLLWNHLARYVFFYLFACWCDCLLVRWCDCLFVCLFVWQFCLFVNLQGSIRLNRRDTAITFNSHLTFLQESTRRSSNVFRLIVKFLYANTNIHTHLKCIRVNYLLQSFHAC